MGTKLHDSLSQLIVFDCCCIPSPVNIHTCIISQNHLQHSINSLVSLCAYNGVHLIICKAYTMKHKIYRNVI